MLATAGPSPLWYLTRGAGAVTLVLLTVSVVLGIFDQRRWRATGWPRFVLDGLHRNVSLLVVVILAIHIVTAIADSFAPIGLKDAVVPFVSSYRPIWLGLGALAFDLLLAIVVTSLLRQRLGHRAWLSVHWLAYATWPIAVVHGLGTGTDTKAAWMLALTGACVAAVCVATWIRVVAGSPQLTGQRKTAVAALIVGPVALLAWLPRGPLGSAWPRRAGTPSRILAASANVARGSTAVAVLDVPFSARLSGTLRRSGRAGGLITVDLMMRFRTRTSDVIDVRLEGQPLAGGGVQMNQSQVTLGPSSSPTSYRGQVVALNGKRLQVVASDASGRSLRLNMALAIDSNTGTVGGTISGRRESGGGQ